MNVDSNLVAHATFDPARAQLVTTCYHTAELSADYETVKSSLYIDNIGRFFSVDVGYSADGRRFSQTQEISKIQAHAWCRVNSIDLDTINRLFETPTRVEPELEVICLLTRKWQRDQAQTD